MTKMIEPKVGQVWTYCSTKELVTVVELTLSGSVRIKNSKGSVWSINRDAFIPHKGMFFFNKEETLNHLKQQQEEINQQIEELNKPEIVKHKFEVVVYAPENFDPNKIFNSLECTVYNYWRDGDITNYSVDVIKE